MADTGPIIAFARIDRLGLLEQVSGTLVVPEAVYEDLVVRGAGRPGAAAITRAGWIQQRSVSDRTAVEKLPPPLHRGEREAIILAEELGAPLLIDEKRGRRVARDRGLRVVGSLAILAEAKRNGFVTQAKPVLDAMLASEYWLDDELIPAFLREVGE